MLERVIDFFNSNPKGWLATVDQYGCPRTRPFLFLMELHGRLFWGTDRSKDVYEQLHNNPLVEFGSTSVSLQTIRVRGEVVFSENREVKRLAWEKYEILKKIFVTEDNQDWEVFYLDHGQALFYHSPADEPEIIDF